MTKLLKKPLIAAIAALDKQRVIGHQGQLPWYMPADLRHFKQTTLSHPIIMGRNTFESIGRPLPHRQNIVISRRGAYQAPGCIVTSSLEDAIRIAAMEDVPIVFIIGGALLYEAAMPFLDKLYLTHIHAIFQGDALFPDWQASGSWILVRQEDHEADKDNPHAYSFCEYERKK